jgi:molecular chaperone GrpE
MPTSPANDALPNDAEPHVNTGNEVPETTGGAGDVAALREEVAALREELARTEDRHRRALADLDNYRKRVEREGDQRAAAARRSVLGEWLEAVDSVDRALRMEPGDPGLSAVLAQMEGILARHGIARIGAAGERFDPARHEAIAAHPADGVPDYTVLEVARSGFAADNGEVLRPAQVVVARSPAGES